MHTSSISVAEVRKPPDIAQAHSISHAGEDKLNLVSPVPSPWVFIFLHWLAWNCSVLQQRQGETWRWLQVTGRQVCLWDSAATAGTTRAPNSLRYTDFTYREPFFTYSAKIRFWCCKVYLKFRFHQYHVKMVNNTHLWGARGGELFMNHAHTHMYWIFAIKYYLLYP